MRVLVLLPLLLAACSGGGGSEAPIIPTTEIKNLHGDCTVEGHQWGTPAYNDCITRHASGRK